MRIQFDQAMGSLLRESIRNNPRGVANLGTEYFELWMKNTVEASRPGSPAKPFPQQAPSLSFIRKTNSCNCEQGLQKRKSYWLRSMPVLNPISTDRRVSRAE